jgi:hypothetical protein
MWDRFGKWLPVLMGVVLLVVIAASVVLIQIGEEPGPVINMISALIILGLMFARSRMGVAYRRIKVEHSQLRPRLKRRLEID